MTNTGSNRGFEQRLSEARKINLRFTVAAMATGAVPVPGASVAIVAENAAQMSAIAGALGVPVSIRTVVSSLGAAGSINIVGRTVFVEAARALGWFAGPLGVPGVCALGATTAGLQTWVLGELAIAVCRNGGVELSRDEAKRVAESAATSFKQVDWERVRRAKATAN